MIVDIAMNLYQSDDEKTSFQSLLTNHFLDLYEDIINNTQLGKAIAKVHEPILDILIELILAVQPILSRVYDVYFHHEKSTSMKEETVISKSKQ